MTPDQHRTIYDAQVEAFRDHWGHREGSEHGFEATYARKELDTSLWAVAWAGDEVAGVVENWIWADENAQLGRRARLAREGQRPPAVPPEGPRPGARRRVAPAVPRRRHDRRDARASTRPTRSGRSPLYEGVGFEVERRELAYRRTDEPRPASEATI